MYVIFFLKLGTFFKNYFGKPDMLINTLAYVRYIDIIQRVTEISTLILTGNRTRQKEQLFYLTFCRKTMFNSKKNWRDFSLK
jgi:hypothetical protein